MLSSPCGQTQLPLSRAFLKYTRTHCIKVICYPSHSTHIFQGLDVVIFSPLKKNWSDARDDWERSSKRVDKMSFLEVYARAHFKTLTEANIKTAFRVTGIVPFNPDIITEDMMAPAWESSSAGLLPVTQHPVIQQLAEMLGDYLNSQAAPVNASLEGEYKASTGSLDSPSQTRNAMQTMDTTIPFIIRSAANGLASTSASFLTSSVPIQSSHELPHYQPFPISPQKPHRYKGLIDRSPQMEHEQNL